MNDQPVSSEKLSIKKGPWLVAGLVVLLLVVVLITLAVLSERAGNAPTTPTPETESNVIPRKKMDREAMSATESIESGDFKEVDHAAIRVTESTGDGATSTGRLPLTAEERAAVESVESFE